MPLSDIDLAYNELVDCINDRDRQILALVVDRNRAAAAAELLHSGFFPPVTIDPRLEADMRMRAKASRR